MRRIPKLRRTLGLMAFTLAVGVLPAPAADAEPGGGPGGSPGDWPTWQGNLRGSRHNGHETRISGSNVSGLRLKWAFVFPNPDNENAGQPAVVGNSVYVGGRDGRFYALDARTGRTRWTFDITQVSGPIGPGTENLNPLRDGPSVADGKVIFGDYRGWLYALDTDDGALVWATKLDEHPRVAITSSPIVAGGRVYVGVSSSEAVASADPTYPCCTFRGSLVSLDLDTGEIRFKRHTGPLPQPAGTWPNGTPRFSPAGAPVWSSPVVERSTNTVYFATGQNYTGTEGDFDSVIALDATTGATRWTNKVTDLDRWTVGCIVPGQPNCEGLEDGTNSTSTSGPRRTCSGSTAAC